MAGRLQGKIAVITGAGSGMGKAMAFLAARLGANVAICGRTVEKLVVKSSTSVYGAGAADVLVLGWAGVGLHGPPGPGACI